MLKRISTKDVRQGMFIQKFCGSWIDHPFWRNKFVITDPADLELVKQCNVAEVWIDVSKGCDIDEGGTALQEATTVEEVDALPAEDDVAPDRLAPTPTIRELQRAAQICNSARQAVTSMFADVRMGRAINREVARQVVEDIADSVTRNSGALISLARLKTADDYTYMHSVAVCALMVALSRQLGMSDDDVRAAGFAGLLHDLGKADVPMDILNKPGKLTDEEFAQVKLHPAYGVKRLLEAGVDDAVVIDVCLHHHEKLDGTGYPKRLAGENISVMARMGAICDIYDAITSNRPYKAGWDPAESLARMAKWVNTHLDARLFQAFVKSVGIYPTGSLVLLNTGRLAVVVEQSKASLLKPVVKTVYSTVSNERIVPQLIDLSSPSCRHTIERREDPAKWNIPDLDALWAGTGQAS